MSRHVSLRPWQRDALDAFGRRRGDNFLAVACPGAGKTTFALAACRQYLAGESRPLVVVVPTQHLKLQWAEAAARFGIHLDPEWSERAGLASDMHGIVTTYAQVAMSSGALAGLVTNGMVVLDEIHHAADERSWGDGVTQAFATAACRLLLSGTNVLVRGAKRADPSSRLPTRPAPVAAIAAHARKVRLSPSTISASRPRTSTVTCCHRGFFSIPPEKTSLSQGR